MKYTVIVWRAWSPNIGMYVSVELAYPMMDVESAKRMFLREYPNATELETWEFDRDERPDYYEAFKNSDAIRFWRTY